MTFNIGGHSRDSARAIGAIDIPCGQCLGCRLQRSRDWAIRCMHEAQLHEDNVFVTLTYSDAHLPPNKSLVYRDFQLFMKRVRSHFKRPIRFYMCGEYGDRDQRPHYHACLFNLTFPDLKYWSKNQNGDTLYTSELLDKLWGKGICNVGQVTLQSAGYCARYILQKVTGDLAEAHYGQRVPEFNRMSLGGRQANGGIGAGWLARYRSDFFPCDYVVTTDGHKDRVPRYYDKLNERFDADQLAAVKLARQLNAAPHWADNTDARLRTKATVKAAATKQLVRPL